MNNRLFLKIIAFLVCVMDVHADNSDFENNLEEYIDTFEDEYDENKSNEQLDLKLKEMAEELLQVSYNVSAIVDQELFDKFIRVLSKSYDEESGKNKFNTRRNWSTIKNFLKAIYAYSIENTTENVEAIVDKSPLEIIALSQEVNFLIEVVNLIKDADFEDADSVSELKEAIFKRFRELVEKRDERFFLASRIVSTYMRNSSLSLPGLIKSLKKNPADKNRRFIYVRD